MRKSTKFLPIVMLTLSMLAAFGSYCGAQALQNIPQSVQTVLNARENQFGKTTFLWTVAATKSCPGLDPKDLAQAQKSVALQAESRARKMGMTDKAQIKQFVDKEIKIVLGAEAGYSFHFTNQWRFSNNDRTTEIFGRNQFTPDAAFDYYERYGDRQGLIANTDLKSAGIAYVWATSGKSTQFFSPFQSSLNLIPQDFALFAGKNPLKMYASVWKVISNSESALVLETQQTQGAFAPFQLLMTLDPKHGYAPSRIQAKGKIWATDYSVQSYRQDEQGWVPSRVTINEHWFDLQIHRELTLAAVNPSAPVLSKFPTLSVVDYRLLGENPMTAQVEDAGSHRDSRIISYPWTGRLPSLDALKKLHQQQNPGESTPDPGKTSSAAIMPFVGGMMCLVGGVWMFKRRGVN